MTEIETRYAKETDANEIVRLAYSMWTDFGYPNVPDNWEPNFHDFFKEALNNSNYRIFVCDHPDKPSELIAMGTGIINQLTPAFWLPNGKMGYLQWFYTNPQFRGKGIASRILSDLMQWFDENEITRAELHASKSAEPLYTKHGFEDNEGFRNLWWFKPGTTFD